MQVKVVNKSKHNLPFYATALSAGMDIKADTDVPVTIAPGACVPFPTGLFIGLPAGYEAQIRSRSGMGCKYGIIVAQGVATIDADYRGEIKVFLRNLSQIPYVVQPGDRIAQMVVAKHEVVEWDECTQLDATERGDGGFGHSGK